MGRIEEMAGQLEIVVDLDCQTGECPVWNPVDKMLYWADIPRGKMYRYDPATGCHEEVFQGKQLGALIVQEDGSILQFLEDGVVQIWREDGIEVSCAGIAFEKGNRFNDAIADPHGRALAGTMPNGSRPARLYRFDLDGTPRVLLDDVEQSNGMAFNHDGSILYHTDTKRKTITKYRYGEILEEPRALVSLSDGDAVPDGLTIDEEGCLWSAHWGGSRLVRYSPNGQEIGRVEFPVRKVSSAAFGGKDYQDLYVTTAGGEDRNTNGPLAGALFRITLGVAGMPRYASRLGERQ